MSRRSARLPRSKAWIGVLLAAATIATACGSNGGDDVASADSGDRRGGDFVYLDAEVPVSFQLQTGGSFWQTSAIVNNLVDRLVYLNLETKEVEPWIAESWTIDPTGKQYTFKIRDGVTYSDGSALDLENVRRNLTLNAFGDEAKGITRSSYFPKVDSVTADPATNSVTISLAETRPYFLQVLSEQNLGFVSNKTLDLSREDQSSVLNLIGSGPFVATKEEAGKEIVLERRDGYDWAPPSFENQGEAYLDSISFIPVLEDSVRLGSLRSGQGDALRYVQPSEEAALDAAGFNIIEVATGTSGFGVRVQANPALGDPRVRQALQVGVDRQGLVDDLLTDRWRPARSVVADNQPWFVDESSKLEFDEGKANALLDDAGWSTKNSDGIRTKDGQPLALPVYIDVYTNIAKPLFELIQNQYKNIGIDLQLKETDYSKYPTAVKDETLGLLSQGSNFVDPFNLTNSFGSKYADSLQLKGSDPKLDELLQAQLNTTDSAQSDKILADIQAYLIDQGYFIPTIDNSQIYVTQSYVHGLTHNATARPNFQGVWLSEK
ncbi:ABC transporter substrate-binding protein [Rhodococcoides yunnanense]|uniref:ABC transporter substrate-binding protein n=1 Tax=Rhodococcoides yunnanense TaxID=278209 RepID=UPI000934C91E|nr:ABC transporter substrate-binding protein [Rhodococcus yunnanensis]